MQRIYDCFTFFNELDVLDIRLKELSSIVDRFVLVESTKTLLGEDKPLYFLENKHRFTRFLDKIEHIIVEFPGILPPPPGPKSSQPTDPEEAKALAREYYQREQILRGLEKAQPHDLIIISEVDEVPRQSRLGDAKALRRPDDIVVFTMPFYCYQLRRRARDFKWDYGPRMLEYRFLVSPQAVRSTEIYGSVIARAVGLGTFHARWMNWWFYGLPNTLFEIRDGGWHFSHIGTWATSSLRLKGVAGSALKAAGASDSQESYLSQLDEVTEIVPMSEMPGCVIDNPRQYAAVLG